jgi:DNA-directed RNA polymerase subunit RPC12/RpoP
MTIEFNCPSCGALIAFESKHAGKRAHCINCGQRFIIPQKNYETPEKIEPEPEEAGEPLPGFYHAVFVESWRLFTKPENATGLVFVVAAVCFKFFVGHTDYSFTMGAFRVYAKTGLITTLSAWGCLFWYYMEIIHSTAFDVEELPDVHMGGLFGFIWNVVVSLSTFVLSLLIVLLTCIMFLWISRKFGFDWPVVAHLLAIAGLFAFPMVLLTFSVGRDVLIAARPDYIIKPIISAFWPYLIIVGLFVIAWELQLHTVGYGKLIGKSTMLVGLHLFTNLAVQGFALIAMRSTGLFYRHYSCYFPW